MSTVTPILATGNQMITNYDVKKFLLGDNSFVAANYTDGGAGSTVVAGQLMGRITATGKIVPQDSAAVDGSQFPVGVNIAAKTVGAAATAELQLVNKGRVASDLLVLKAGVALTDDVDGRQLKDWLSDIGLELMSGTELTAFDNQ
jgi:hypothetical protein